MKVEDIVMIVEPDQELTIDVIMYDDVVDGKPHTYSMNWYGCAESVPLNIMITDVRGICVDEYDDGCLRNRLHIFSEM